MEDSYDALPFSNGSIDLYGGGGGSSFNWGESLTGLLGKGLDIYGQREILRQQAQNGRMYLEGQRGTYPYAAQATISPTMLLLIGGALLLVMVKD